MDPALKLASQGSLFILTCHLTQEGSNFRCYLMTGIKGWKLYAVLPLKMDAHNSWSLFFYTFFNLIYCFKFDNFVGCAQCLIIGLNFDIEINLNPRFSLSSYHVMGFEESLFLRL
jgi:hypothetical protein